MKFYRNIAHYYDYIFPYKEIHKEFLLSLVNSPENRKILDIGCGTGSLTMELGKIFSSVYGIDLSKDMIDMARRKNSLENVHFYAKDMLTIDSFGKEIFHIIFSFGNTIAHLPDKKSLFNLFKSANYTLKRDGVLSLQIINYDRILDNGIEALPTIENEYIRFERIYSHCKKRIEFKTILTIKREKKKIISTVELYPFKKRDIENALLENNFHNIEFFGSFKREPLLDSSIPLIAIAKK